MARVEIRGKRESRESAWYELIHGYIFIVRCTRPDTTFFVVFPCLAGSLCRACVVIFSGDEGPIYVCACVFQIYILVHVMGFVTISQSEHRCLNFIFPARSRTKLQRGSGDRLSASSLNWLIGGIYFYGVSGMVLEILGNRGITITQTAEVS